MTWDNYSTVYDMAGIVYRLTLPQKEAFFSHSLTHSLTFYRRRDREDTRLKQEGDLSCWNCIGAECTLGSPLDAHQYPTLKAPEETREKEGTRDK